MSATTRSCSGRATGNCCSDIFDKQAAGRRLLDLPAPAERHRSVRRAATAATPSTRSARCPISTATSTGRVEGERRRQAIMRRLSETRACPVSRSEIVTSSFVTPLHFRDALQSEKRRRLRLRAGADCRAPGSGRTTAARTSRSLSGRRGHASRRRPAGRPLLRQDPRQGRAACLRLRVLKASPRRPTAPPAGSSIRQGSHSFYLASLLLPVAIREPAYAVYAFCRMADDLIDREARAASTAIAAARPHARPHLCRPPAARAIVERGFADVVARFAIPRAVPDALIEGLGLGRRGPALRDARRSEAYAVRVAGTVGFMMTLVMGRREPHVLARACDLGVAMQLTNIARDIGEDAATGRIYMPLTGCARTASIADAWCAAPAYLPPVQVVGAAPAGRGGDALLPRSLPGIAALPGSCAPRHRRRAAALSRDRPQDRTRRRSGHHARRHIAKREAGAGGKGCRLPAHGSADGLEAAAVPAAHFLLEAVAASPVAGAPARIAALVGCHRPHRRMMDLLVAFSARAAVAEKAPPARLRAGQAQPVGRSA